MPSRIRTSRLISSHIKRCHLLFASYGHIAGDSHGMCWSVNDRSSGHSGPGWYHQEWKEFLASSNNVTHHSHWSVFHGNHVTFQTFPDGKVWLPGRSRTWIPWPSPRDRGTKPRTHCCVRACFGKSHDHQGNRRRNHALPTQFLVCKFAPETKTDRSSVVSPSRVNLLHHAPRSKLCESNQVLRLY